MTIAHPTSQSDTICVLELRGTLLTPLMARNALKSNVTWTSYPFVPPTSASGFFADLLGDTKWHEGNDNRVRHLHELPEYRNVFALGAYPTYGQMSRRHFRAHIGSLSFSYEAYIWSASQNEGKKLAVVEEFLTDELRFVLVARERELLRRLYQAARGRIARLVKKGCVQLEFTSEPKISLLTKGQASGHERPLTILAVSDVGAFPIGAIPFRVALRSEGTNGGIRWYTYDCLWDIEARFRSGTPIYADSQGMAIGESVLKAIGVVDRYSRDVPDTSQMPGT